MSVPLERLAEEGNASAGIKAFVYGTMAASLEGKSAEDKFACAALYAIAVLKTLDVSDADIAAAASKAARTKRYDTD